VSRTSPPAAAPHRAHVDVAVADLPELLRRQRVGLGEDGPRLAFGSVRQGAHLRIGGRARVDVDVHNLSAEADGGGLLAYLARALLARGLVLPIARPLPHAALAEACACVPYLVDAFVQQVAAVTLDGEPYDTPRAPRSATGPSLVHALCSRPPLAIAVRVRLRVASAARTRVVVREMGSTGDAARLLVDAHHEARAYAVEALGSRVVALVGDGTPSLLGPPSADARFAHVAGGRFHSSRAIVPGDADAIAELLGQGERVATAPFMGRAAVLERSFRAVPLLDVPRAAAGIASALAAGAGGSHG
jgi:hypothetical protein